MADFTTIHITDFSILSNTVVCRSDQTLFYDQQSIRTCQDLTTIHESSPGANGGVEHRECKAIW